MDQPIILFNIDTQIWHKHEHHEWHQRQRGTEFVIFSSSNVASNEANTFREVFTVLFVFLGRRNPIEFRFTRNPLNRSCDKSFRSHSLHGSTGTASQLQLTHCRWLLTVSRHQFTPFTKLLKLIIQMYRSAHNRNRENRIQKFTFVWAFFICRFVVVPAIANDPLSTTPNAWIKNRIYLLLFTSLMREAQRFRIQQTACTHIDFALEMHTQTHANDNDYDCLVRTHTHSRDSLGEFYGRRARMNEWMDGCVSVRVFVCAHAKTNYTHTHPVGPICRQNIRFYLRRVNDERTRCAHIAANNRPKCWLVFVFVQQNKS